MLETVLVLKHSPRERIANSDARTFPPSARHRARHSTADRCRRERGAPVRKPAPMRMSKEPTSGARRAAATAQAALFAEPTLRQSGEHVIGREREWNWQG